MRDDPAKIIDKIIWSILGTGGALAIKLMLEQRDLNQNILLQLSKIATQLEYHEQRLKFIRDSEETVFKIETELGMHDKRISRLENEHK